jgi:hypothetical protein
MYPTLEIQLNPIGFTIAVMPLGKGNTFAGDWTEFAKRKHLHHPLS